MVGLGFGFGYWLLFGYWVLVLSLNCSAVVGGGIWLIGGGYGWWQWLAKREIGRETKFSERKFENVILFL